MHPESPNLETVLRKLENKFQLAIVWFDMNFMKLNSGKCHVPVSGYKHEHCFVKIKNNTIWESKSVKLLGVNINNSLKFEEHISKLFSKANQKLSVLIRVANFLSFDKKRILFKSFFYKNV